MTSLSHIGIIVNDLDRMEEFYCKVFDMKIVWKKVNDKSYLTTGNNDILGLQVDSNFENNYRVTLESIDNADGFTPVFFHFGTVSNSKEEYFSLRKKLEKMNIAVSKNKISRDKSESFYCHDPEGNCIQICYIPKGYLTKSI